MYPQPRSTAHVPLLACALIAPRPSHCRRLLTPARRTARAVCVVLPSRSKSQLEPLVEPPAKAARPDAVAASPRTALPIPKAAAAAAAAQPDQPAAAGGALPEGAGQCFRNCVFVVTGEFPRIGSREAAEDFVKEHGGKVTGAVSGRTTYLLRGVDHNDVSRLQEGSKVVAAGEKGVPILSEPELLDLVRAAAGGALPERVAEAQRKAADADAKAAKAAAKKGAAASPSPAKAAGGAAGKLAAHAPTTAAIGPPLAPRREERESSGLWTDRYAPASFDELIGNQAAAKKLTDWLRDFKAGKAEKKAALLSGPPGIGKTTAAKLATRLAGLDAVEFNASDVRSKGAIRQHTAAMSDNHTLLDFQRAAPGGAGGSAGGAAVPPPSARGRLALIMDEVDGMGGGDRGGMQELIGVIKHTRVPIICICNDRQDQKVKSLANYCVDIRFQRAPAATIAKRMAAIASREGVPMEPAALEKIAEVSRADIRQVLNVLQMWRPSAAARAAPTKALGFGEVKARLAAADKDCALNIFDIAPKFFCAGGLSVEERLRLYFADDLVALFVQENYLSSRPARCRAGDELMHLNVRARAPAPAAWPGRGEAGEGGGWWPGLAGPAGGLGTEGSGGEGGGAHERRADRTADWRCRALPRAARRADAPARTWPIPPPYRAAPLCAPSPSQMVAAAANAISEGDVAQTAIMRSQRWELSPFAGIMSAVLPGYIMQGGLAGHQPRFPSWLGKNSTATKNRRLARDLHSHMMAHTSAGKLQTLLCYLPPLHQALTRPLAEKGAVRSRRARAGRCGWPRRGACRRAARAHSSAVRPHALHALPCAPARCALPCALHALPALLPALPPCALLCARRAASTRWWRP